MTKELIRESILQHLAACKPVQIVDESVSVFSERYMFEARDLVYVCLRMKEQYGCNLNPVIEKVNRCSVDELTNAFWGVLSE